MSDISVKDDLPNQQKFFSQDKLRRSARSGSQLPDPKVEPYGYDPRSRFDHIFPRINHPPLLPPASHHPDDTISFGSSELPPHELYLGDNLSVLRTIPSESIDLIYIDPPFFSNRNYTQIWWDENEVRSFGDIFEDGMPSYLAWLNARLYEMKRVLKNTGSIYVHCDWHASHYIKCEMDKIFGYENFQNEIVWCYTSGGASKDSFAKKHDLIFCYGKTKWNTHFNTQYYKRYALIQDGKEVWFDPRIEYFTDEKWRRYRMNLAVDWWSDIGIISPNSINERIGYPTQKPESLLERIIKASSNEGDVVADFFSGWGTTWAVAMKLGRRFIGSDISRVAVSVTANRLTKIGEEMSGVTWNGNIKHFGEREVVADIKIGYVGSYPIEKFSGMDHDEFASFVVGLYAGMPYTGEYHDHIHGLANSRLVLSVGPSDPDAIIGVEFVKSALEATMRAFKVQLSRWEEKILQVIGWRFDPLIDTWKRQTTDYLNKQWLKIQIEMVALGSESFRERVFRVIGESNIDLKFNRLNSLLNFAGTPYAGKISMMPWTKPERVKNGICIQFSLEWARPVGTATLINAQWDFDVVDGRFADREHALNRSGKGGKFEAILTVEHIFPEVNEYLIAGRVQDSMDGEATVYARLMLTENMSSGEIEYRLENLT